MTEAYKSDVRLQISAEFIGLTEVISKLRALLNADVGGGIQPVFNIFKQHFEILFLLSSDDKEINSDVVKDVKAWIDNKQNPLYPSDIKDGIDLFYKYKSELFRLNILE